MEKSVGSIAVTEQGQVVMLTRLDECMDYGNNQVGIFDLGIVLRGPQAPVGANCRIKRGQGMRVVSSIGEVLRMLEQTKVDLSTRAEKPLTSLTTDERIERLERENAKLRANAAR